MTQVYFGKFPTIEYSNTIMRDLTRRVIFPPSLTNIATAFYPYDIEFNQRSDVVSYNYYKDEDADWIIYLTNQVIDPYYGWYLNDDEFNSYMIQKYGDLVDPQQRIIYWITNWFDDSQNATTSYYNALPPEEQKYYSPVWGSDNQIIFYTRRQEDWFMNTNQIWTLGVANNSSFNVGDLVSSVTNSQFVEGQAEVVGSFTNTVIIKNIANNFSVGSALCQLSNTLVNTAISNVSITLINIPLSEGVYWEPITYYEWEKDKNEKNKTLILLDNQFLNDASNALQQNLNE